jgi:hypothetical protein
MALQDMGGYTKITCFHGVRDHYGGAIFPLVYGYLAETINLANEANGVTETKQKWESNCIFGTVPSYLMIIFYLLRIQIPSWSENMLDYD